MYLTCNLTGRLGNYFFIIISSWSYAKKYNLEFIMDISFKSNKYYNSFFNKVNLINRNLTNWQIKNFSTFENSLISQPNNTTNLLFLGYLQNANNFDIYRNDVLEYFFNITKPLEPNDNFFIHIRLTDFKNSHIHNINLENYYVQAIELACKQIDFSNVNIYIISDDIVEAKKKEYLKLLPEKNLIFVDNLVFDEVKTFELFKNCYLGCIIGNSTFSWWGAYIIANPSKLVIIPSKFLNTNDDFSGLYLNYQVIEVK